MKLIAHRGLFDGPFLDRENHPDQINLALSQGFDVELDLWVDTGRLVLGHDRPQYEVFFGFLSQPGLWIHCKNFEALRYMRGCLDRISGSKLNFFWHDQDDFTLTSQGFIWTYPGKPLTAHGIWVQPEWDPDWRQTVSRHRRACYGMCSKHVREINTILHE